MQWVDYMQVTGGLIAVFGYVPQIARIVRARSVDGISLGMWGSVFVGLSLTEAYAIDLFMSGRPTVLLTNTLSLALCTTLIALVVWFGRGARAERVPVRARLRRGR